MICECVTWALTTVNCTIYFVFLQILQVLEEEDDINQINDFFSYEHFYVIYCKFWELDKDHDLFIDRADLARHNEHGKSVSNQFLSN